MNEEAPDVQADTEQERQRAQAQAEHDRLAAEQDNAEDRVRLAREGAEIDPASPEGQQAAMRRGDPVQLTGDEMLGGRRMATNTTSNESLVQPVVQHPGPQGRNFVTGAAGEPIPVDEGVVPERPSVGQQDFETRDVEPPEVAGAPYEQGEAERQERAEQEYAERREPVQPEGEPVPEDETQEPQAQPVTDQPQEAADPTEPVARDGAEGPGVSA